MQRTIHKLHKLPNLARWTGRKTDPSAGLQYWHQAVGIENDGSKIALLGYECDEGVRRNQGRTGAKKGPDAVIERLGKLPYHHSPNTICDYGNIICLDQDLDSAHDALSATVLSLLKKQIFPILIGGGHDIAYAHARGILQSIPTYKNLGIINFDAHFDLRQSDGNPTSGTPFSQLLHEYGDRLGYMAVGIQQSANTKELYDRADELGVSYIENYSCQEKHWDQIIQRFETFTTDKDYIYITIDMDGFSSAYAPGVSAPSPLGFTPYFVLKCLKHLFEKTKIISCDIAEINPIFDIDNNTASLAARLIDFIVGLKEQEAII